MRKRIMLITAVLLAAAGAGFGCGAAASGGTRQLVYVCQVTPCQFGQELEVFDGHAAPIFSVGEYGGAGVFGDNFSVFGRDVFHPGLVLSPESPAAYDREFGLPYKCLAPERWLEPQGNWRCTTAGTWVKG